MKKLPYRHPVSVAAHRGVSAHVAENTREAFAAAVACGCDMIETDIHLTKDNVLVLMHDDAVDRTTDGSGRIADYTYEEIRALNCNPRGEFSEIPTLDEFLAYAVENDMMVNLEIKEYNVGDNGDRCRLCVEKTLAMVEKYNWVEKTIINSFDAYVLEYTDEISGGKYLLYGFYPYSIMRNVSRNPDEYLYCACIFDDGNADCYKYLQDRGIEPWAGAGVKTKEHFDSCVKLGAVLFTSNDPAAAMQDLCDLGHR
ncbi:MAG: hypothetical protein IJ302_04580 [Clostridia bacterium]|nr:hypothetical protein [Clostridia bacterium]